MSDAGLSPAPWSIERSSLSGLSGLFRDASGSTIATFTGMPRIHNARAMLAAPEMLGALQLLLAVRPENWADEDDLHQRMAWAAAEAALKGATAA